ncbi:PKD domain-containing protein [Haloferax larsenii]|uniref:PKD domain-containing protein n=1 Tax=Haloferax larsenii TaxID=302484 RepID=A0ABY5RDU5_HALLR|nr:PKD domain-containing protein [Haloferax larsenii]UVE50519.1 PKD domain-containing protein [Haloferax larsenii]
MRLHADTRGQVEQIGTILLVGIVILSVGTFGVFYMGQTQSGGAGDANAEAVATADFRATVSQSTLKLHHLGGDPFSTDDLRVIARNESREQTFSLTAANLTGDDAVFHSGETAAVQWNQPPGEVVTVLLVDDDGDRVVFRTEVVIDNENEDLESEIGVGQESGSNPGAKTDPTADAGNQVTIDGIEGETAEFSGDGTDPDGGDVTYQWRIVDWDGLSDSQLDFTSGTESKTPVVEIKQNITDRDHELTVELEVEDDEGNTTTDQTTLVVERLNRPPEADAGEDQGGADDEGDGDDGDDSDEDDGDEDNEDDDRDEDDRDEDDGDEDDDTDRIEGPVFDTTRDDGVFARIDGQRVQATIGNGGILTFSLDGSGSFDPDGDELSYEWTVAENDSAPILEHISLTNSGSVTPTLTVSPLSLAENRTITVQLTVTESSTEERLSDTDTVNITLLANNEQPTARLDADCTGLTCAFDASASSDGDLGLGVGQSDSLSYEWDFGDGTTQTTDSPTVTHTYGESDEYDVSVTVSDGSASDSVTKTVRAGTLRYVTGTGVATCGQTNDRNRGHGNDCDGYDEDNPGASNGAQGRPNEEADHIRFDIRNDAEDEVRITGVSIVDTSAGNVYVEEDWWPFDDPSGETVAALAGSLSGDWTRLTGVFEFLYDAETRDRLDADSRLVPTVDPVSSAVSDRTLDPDEEATVTLGPLYRDANGNREIDLSDEDVTVRVTYEYVEADGTTSDETQFTFTDGEDDSDNEPTIRGLRLEDQSQYSNAEYDISYDVSNADPNGWVEVAVDNRDNTWSDSLLWTSGTRGTAWYFHGGTMGDTYEITVRAYRADGTLLTEESIVDVADGTDPSQKGTLTKPTSPTIESVSVKDKTKRDNGDYQVKVKVDDDHDEFSRTEVVFQNNDHSWATRTESSTQKNAVLRYRRGGVEDDSYDIVVRVVDNDGIVVDEQVVADTADGTDP